MKDLYFVYEWLNSINQPSAADEILPNKTRSRKRAYPSPDPEDLDPLDMSAISTPQKRRRVDENNELDQTPRETILNPNPRPSPSSSPTKSSASLRSASSLRSGSHASSSRHKLSQLDLGQEGIVKRQLKGPGTPQLPLVIKHVLLRIQRLERCRGVLSTALDAPDALAFLQEFDLDDTVFDTNSTGGSRLAPSDVDEILLDAQRCFEMDHDEPVWNVEVHHPLLKKVFRRPSSTFSTDRLVDISLCTTAPIIREYLPIPLSDRRIDFCLYIDPRGDSNYPPKIDILRQQLPERSVNHTSYSPLLSHPTTVSFETKRSGNDFDGGIPQIAVWQAAHWKMLRSLLRKKAREGSSVTTAQSRLGQGNTLEEDYVNNALKELGALHGILIQGHEWYYVATSPELTNDDGQPSSRTFLWLHQPIGRTSDALGLHKIAAFLEYMKVWTATSYWPWFKRHFLDTG
ncbi:hypothetical protein FZEAL_5897 [Fusarium zealandicum]|uniref:PD-(D/E)XK nuclease-like domain-containing protein n=1 Tax=Fusarium zealandicum TaxID=1053134 RepID=A0A8H4XJE3_9HYPO|nr:hypothetical protein FZEAL_5897 [Fusarium zealandicum]